MVTLEAKYHKSCFNRAKTAASSTSGKNNDHSNLHSIALAELVAYMEDIHNEASIAPVLN